MRVFLKVCFMLACLSLSACNQGVVPGENANPYSETNEIAESNFKLGVAYLKNGNYEKALEKLTKSIRADSRYGPAYNALGVLYEKIGQMDKAEDNFKKALSLNKSDSSTLNNYGLFLCQNGRFEEAENTLLKAANNPLYETPEIAYANMAICYLKQDRKDEAEKYFRSALDLNPRLPTALIHMCEISYNQNNYLSARAYLQRYLEVAKHTPKSLWLGIRIENELGNQDALSSYSLLLKNNFPDSEEAKLLKQSGLK